MFTQKCFIRKNTPELREKLKNLGIRHNCFDDNEGEWLASNYGMFISVFPGFENLHDEDIDCGENEELFLAIAAIRNDSDKNQWFVHNNKVFGDSGWEICKRNKFKNVTYAGCVGDEDYFYDNTDKFHKATVEELIEHFKGNDV